MILQGQALIDQMAEEKIQHNSLDAICCADLHIHNKKHIFLLFADKDAFHLASQVPDYFIPSFALHGRFPPFYTSSIHPQHLVQT